MTVQPPLEKLRALADRDGVAYTPETTLAELAAALRQLPKHAEAQRLAERLRPTSGQPGAIIGSGDTDVEYPA